MEEQITVTPQEEEEEIDISQEIDDSRRNLIVNYIPSSLSEEALKGIFMPFGELESCKLMVDKIDGLCISRLPVG